MSHPPAPGLGAGVTSREGLAKNDQGIWEMLLFPSQRESFPDAGVHWKMEIDIYILLYVK